MYKLYGTKGTGTSAIKAALAEAGVPFEEVEVATREKQHLTAGYQKINPRQQVPALMLPDGSIMTETAAMLLHIADAHPAARLAPPPGTPARAQHDRWLVFLAVNEPYFFGDDPTMLDIYLWTFANWHDTAWLEANCPKIARLVRTVSTRPKIAPIHEENYGA
jgi:glutathione S-transferase